MRAVASPAIAEPIVSAPVAGPVPPPPAVAGRSILTLEQRALIQANRWAAVARRQQAATRNLSAPPAGGAIAPTLPQDGMDDSSEVTNGATAAASVIIAEHCTCGIIEEATFEGKSVGCRICLSPFAIGEDDARLHGLHLFHHACVRLWFITRERARLAELQWEQGDNESFVARFTIRCPVCSTAVMP